MAISRSYGTRLSAAALACLAMAIASDGAYSQRQDGPSQAPNSQPPAQGQTPRLDPPRSTPKSDPQTPRSEPRPRPQADPTKPGEKKDQPQRKAAPGGPRGAPALPKALPAEKYASPAQKRLMLADLYALLQTAADAQTAQKHAVAIERMWQANTSETAIVLIERAGVAMAAKESALALDLLNEAVQLGPDQTETWMRRAYFHVADNNIKAAIGDLRRVLALDPSHFKALQALSNVLKEVGEKPAALKLARQAKDVYPFMDGIQAVIDELERAVEGQGT